MGASANLGGMAQALFNIASTQVSSVPLSGSAVTITNLEASYPVIELTGVLATPCTVTIPAQGSWKILNQTSGGQTVTLVNGAGASLNVPANTPISVLSLPASGVLSVGAGGQMSGVTTFNARSGAVLLQASDITSAGGALLNSPSFMGAPTAPTVSLSTDSTDKLATTAFVQSVVSGLAGGINFVGTWNAATNTPTLTSSTGTKGNMYKVSVAGNTNLNGNSNWNIGDLAIFDGVTWDFIAGQSTQVISFNTRTGAITLQSSDVLSALGFTPANASALSTYALLDSPAFTGVPTVPTAPNGTNTTQAASTAYVLNAMGSFAPVASPTFTGIPAVPTAAPGTSTTQVASTAFVATSFAPKTNPTIAGRTKSDAYAFTSTALGNISGVKTLDLSAASEWSATITGATTFAFTNTLGSNTSEVVYLRLTNAGSAAITWPANTKFAAKSAPALTAAGVDLLGVKYDVTTATYMVFVVGLNIG